MFRSGVCNAVWVASTGLVIFDCDGVLVDSEPLLMRVEMAMIRDLGWQITVDDVYAEHLGRSWPEVQSNIERHIGRPVPSDFHAKSVEVKNELFRAELEPVVGILDAYEDLAAMHFATCVASSGAHERIRFVLGVTELLATFDGRIFSAEDVANGKPEPDLFLHAARSMGFKPSSCVVVEDSPAGVAAACSAGMPVVGYAAQTPRALLADADLIIDDMNQLPEAVASLRASAT